MALYKPEPLLQNPIYSVFFPDLLLFAFHNQSFLDLKKIHGELKLVYGLVITSESPEMGLKCLSLELLNSASTVENSQIARASGCFHPVESRDLLPCYSVKDFHGALIDLLWESRFLILNTI